jgi:competence protein ComEC
VVPTVTLVANVLAFPAVGPAFLGGAVASGAALVWPGAGEALGRVAALPIAYLTWVADRTARLPLPSLVGFRWLAPVGALALVVAVARRLPRPGRKLATVALLPVAVWGLGLRPAPPADLTVVFLDVGQGDAAVVRTPEGHTVLIDAGPDDREVAIKLAALRVTRIDLAVASHAHADHVEGFPAVLARHPVDLLLEPGCPGESPSYLRMLEAAEYEDVPIHHPRGGERLRLGGLLIEVLGPDACTIDSANDDSVVLRLNYGPATVLFPGDAEVPAQRDLLADQDPVQALVLKVPHHGSRTSDPAFFEAVGAIVAVVSVGENTYGHPVPETLAALRASGARVLRTDREGDVTVRFAPERILVDGAR